MSYPCLTKLEFVSSNLLFIFFYWSFWMGNFILVSQSFKIFEWSMTGQPVTYSPPYMRAMATWGVGKRVVSPLGAWCSHHPSRNPEFNYGDPPLPLCSDWNSAGRTAIHQWWESFSKWAAPFLSMKPKKCRGPFVVWFVVGHTRWFIIGRALDLSSMLWEYFVHC